MYMCKLSDKGMFLETFAKCFKKVQIFVFKIKFELMNYNDLNITFALGSVVVKVSTMLI